MVQNLATKESPEKIEKGGSEKRKMSESFDPIPASERHHASVKSNGNAPASNSPAVADANKQQGDAIKKEELEAHIKSIPIHKDHTQYLKTVVNLSPQAFFQ